MQRISPGSSHDLYSVAQTRLLETRAAQLLPAHALMKSAGLAVARLALALAPHAQRIWIACGPGNNGGDGLEAALHLHRWGKQPIVSWLGQPDQAPADALHAYQRIVSQGLQLQHEPPQDADFCIDALLGIGAQLRAPTGTMAQYINCLNASAAPVLSIDVPSGLDADTGDVAALCVHAQHTLSLLTLKPGLFTANGRDVASTVWFDRLGVEPVAHDLPPPIARLLARPPVRVRPNASHKGSYGDVAVVGGSKGMVGAALLAARAALNAGAGRVFVSLLDGSSLTVDVLQPEIMFRDFAALSLATKAIVFGCGGGSIESAVIEMILSSESPLVIDADAINKIASDGQMQALLLRRAQRGLQTVLTPHPLEAARMLGKTTIEVQSDRLSAAQTLSERYGCTVVLKGSGTVVAAPRYVCGVNPCGNAALATAGTGDVLAGIIGAHLAQGLDAFQAACQAVYKHGETADAWPPDAPLTASRLASQGN